MALYGERRYTLTETFNLDARVLHRVLSQRLEQQETVLKAVAVLLSQSEDPQLLRQYVQLLVSPYPQIVGVGWCAQSCVPLTPPLKTAALPFTVPNGAQISLPSRGSLYALDLQQVRMWIDASKLLTTIDLPPAPLTIQILRPAGGELLTEHRAPVRPASLTLSVEKPLGTALEPLPIRFQRDYSWGVWPWAQILAWWVLTGVFVWFLARMLASRRRAEQALEDERRRAQGIVQASSDGIVALDPAGRVVHANPAAHQIFTGLDLGVDIRTLAHFQATLSQQPLESASLWEETQTTTLPAGTALQRGGGRVLIEGHISPLWNESGQLLGRVLTLREVGTLQKRMLAQLSEGERRVREHEALLAHVSRLSTLGEMSAGLAHELNQPLTAIVSYGQAGHRLLAEDHVDLPRARQAMQGMVTQAQRAAEIITRLRKLVKRAPAQRVRVDVIQAVHNVLTLCQADLDRLNIQVKMHLPPCAISRADPVQVEQIVLNLVRNALEAMQDTEERVLTLRVTAQAPYWRLTVLDTGTGLSEQELAQLFQPFNSLKEGGLGLGLTLSQTLAQGMGGDLTGGNASIGAEFTLTLPQWSDGHA
ncbi:hypothetical protein GCM10017783_21160 [Deinococcus piscis]|uniref:histidine kinase n=1 Tax=Deinococcus piscis TaxID=394230 RepID=A0ABQ3KD64_9DEIO|nr:ATP-binding protein [Deinococcus piscis]GHG08350.1 hypothetical protein GCM10017783_21160 [Deinococcus piscis]